MSMDLYKMKVEKFEPRTDGVIFQCRVWLNSTILCHIIVTNRCDPPNRDDKEKGVGES